MTARYPCDFTGTVRAPRGNHAVTVRGPYECPTIPQSPYDLFLTTYPQKSCVCCTITARRPNDARTGIVQWPQRYVYGLRAYDFWKFV